MEQHVDPEIQGFENLTRVIADRVADVLARRGRRLFESVQAQADVDALTGLYSRRYLDRRLSFELGEGRPEGPLCAAMIDIDHFGVVNKTHGWPTGDKVLTGVAARLLDEVRTSDWAARYGGEELLVVLLDTAEPAAVAVIERVRERIGERPYTGAEGQPVGVTASAGVAQLHDGEDAEAFKQRLSRSLLAAKRGGRNRVVAASELPAGELAGSTEDQD
jgi:diguanylate cyclase (GGDEF)-like protein